MPKVVSTISAMRASSSTTRIVCRSILLEPFVCPTMPFFECRRQAPARPHSSHDATCGPRKDPVIARTRSNEEEDREPNPNPHGLPTRKGMGKAAADRPGPPIVGPTHVKPPRYRRRSRQLRSTGRFPGPLSLETGDLQPRPTSSQITACWPSRRPAKVVSSSVDRNCEVIMNTAGRPSAALDCPETKLKKILC
jgi:hypothetical protein